MTLKKFIYRLVRSLVPAYLVVVILLYVFQANFIYFPSHLALTDWQDQARLGGAQLMHEGHSLLIEPKIVEPSTKTVILFHGNAGHALHRLSLANMFLNKGYRVVLAEYPGYGPNAGKPSQEALVQSALRLRDDVWSRWPSKIVLAGESLGAGVAAQVAAQRPDDIENLILITPFASLKETAQKKMWFVPVGPLLNSPFNTLEALKDYHGPSTVVVAGNDEVIGAAAGLAVHKALQTKGPSQLMVLPHATHNTWFFGLTTAQKEALATAQGRAATPAAKSLPGG